MRISIICCHALIKTGRIGANSVTVAYGMCLGDIYDRIYLVSEFDLLRCNYVESWDLCRMNSTLRGALNGKGNDVVWGYENHIAGICVKISVCLLRLNELFERDFSFFELG